jgi:hypothetical protein
MNRLGVLSVQLDRRLRDDLRAFRKKMAIDLGREVPEAEAARILLRRALGGEISMRDSGYVEGWRHGAGAARAAFEGGVAAFAARPR